MTWKRLLLTILMTTLLAACVPEQNTASVRQTHEAELQVVISKTTADDPPTATPTAAPTATPTARPQPTRGPSASELISIDMLANMDYSGLLFEGEAVPLKEGSYHLAARAASDVESEILLSDSIAFGTIDGRPVAGVVLSIEQEDSAAVYSLHIVGAEAGEPEELAYTSLGDAAQVDTVIIANNQIVVELVAADLADAPCCPTQLVVQVYELSGNGLQQMVNEVVGTVAEDQLIEVIARATSEVTVSQPLSDDLSASANANTANRTAVPFEMAAYGEPVEAEHVTGGTGEVNDEPQASDQQETSDQPEATGVFFELEVSLPAGVQPGSVLELLDGGISLKSSGLASSWFWNARPERTSPLEPGGLIYPEHVMITFEGDNLADVLANNGRRVVIFPLHNYLDFSAEYGQSGTAEQIARLQTLVNEASERNGNPRGGMPLLPPPANQAQDWSRFLDLDFEDGRGVRFVIEGNGDTYFYQGLTEDGRYYVSVLWPLDTGYDDSYLEQLDDMVATLSIGS